VIGTGMRLNANDIDSDGRVDIIVACRTGLYVFFNNVDASSCLLK